MKEFKTPIVEVVEFDEADILTASPNTDTSTPEGGNILGGTTSVGSLGTGKYQQ